MIDGKNQIEGGRHHDGRQAEEGQESHPELREEQKVTRGGTVGRIMETVLGAPPRAVILVIGLTPEQYDESGILLHGALAERPDIDITLIDSHESSGEMENFAAIEGMAKDKIYNQPNDRIVVNVPSMIKNMFFRGVDHSEAAERFTRPMEEGEDTAAKLIEWLENVGEDFKGEWTPKERFRHIFSEISALAASAQAGEHSRPVMLAVPMNTMLALALFTYALEHELTPEAIKRTRERYPNTGEAVGVLRIIDGEPIPA